MDVLSRVLKCLLLTLPLSLTACGSLIKPTDFQRTELPNVPTTWSQASEHAKDVVQTNWLKLFNSPELMVWIDKGLRNNPSIASAANRFKVAISAADSAQLAIYPTLSARYQRTRTKVPATSASTGQTTVNYNTQHEIGLASSWELDLWGALSQETKAKNYELNASKWQLESIQLTMAANIARAWFNAISLKQQTLLLQSRIEAAEKMLAVAEAKFRNGLTSAIDVYSARSLLANEKSALKNQQHNLFTGKQLVQRLTGEYPDGQVSLPEALPTLPEAIPAGLPSSLLTRRPDLQAALAKFRAANTRISTAEAKLWPTFTINTQWGSSGSELPKSINIPDMIWSLLTNLTQPLFAQGQIEANIHAAKANATIAETEYVEAAVLAFSDVEAALHNNKTIAARLENTKQATEQAKLAYDISLDRYKNGLTDLAQVLQFQRSYNEAQSQFVQLKAQALLNRINLHTALGGDIGAKTNRLPSPIR